MTFSLYAATIPSMVQILGSVSGLITKAETFCTDNGLQESAVIDARLADDMLPFAYQVKSTTNHSLGAIEGVRSGVFSPDMTPPPHSFATLQERVAQTIAALEAVDPAEVDSFIGRAMAFEMRTTRVDFTAEDFLLTFSQPNFYFHAVTAYDILRMKGVALGKRDFLGRMRTAG